MEKEMLNKKKTFETPKKLFLYFAIFAFVSMIVFNTWANSVCKKWGYTNFEISSGVSYCIDPERVGFSRFDILVKNKPLLKENLCP